MKSAYLLFVLMEDAGLQFLRLYRKIFFDVSGEAMLPRRYISTEYLFNMLSTGFANRQAICGYNDSLPLD